MNEIAWSVTCKLNNIRFSMLFNMHVSKHDMLFSDEPTLRICHNALFGLRLSSTKWHLIIYRAVLCISKEIFLAFYLLGSRNYSIFSSVSLFFGSYFLLLMMSSHFIFLQPMFSSIRFYIRSKPCEYSFPFFK